MALHSSLYGSLLIGCILQVITTTSSDHVLEYMSREEREALKEEARDMFYHAYNAYMDNAYPADELMPLSCKGRYRGSEPNRGDIDSTLGNFSLTLVDTLDTLVVLGDLEEFENAVKLVVRDVNFDTDVIVSLFETNIRMLGGLLSGHILAEYLQQRADIMPWYRGELLNLAKDLGYRFLPAFNTTTGIPYGRINLKYGMKGVPSEVSRETCTACAGSMILEMAALSRLTGEMIFEEKAQKAMDVLWRMRHRGTDLMGTVLNVHSGDWVRRDSGVGAGIDSYYEYCLKAYILLGDEKYLGRFNKHYQAIMKYVSQGPMLLDVHMHRPNTNSKNFMDALLAFWPGLQVLKGDIKPAVETHEMLYQVMQRHNFIPEAFTTDFQVHWGHHPLRPEFLESTYFLYRATGDHYYLGVGRKVQKSLQTYARVPCGYAAVSDVRTNKHDDTMDSFVLSETFKYLFLLFAEPTELVLDLDEFIFTTEGHLLPLTLASVRMNITSQEFERDVVHVGEFDRTCPNSLHLFPASVRQPLRNMVEDICPKRTIKRKLSASQFQANNLEHLKLLSDMGITILTLADGRVQLLHTFSNAKTPQDSEEGLLFMQEMAELSKMQAQQTISKPQSVSFTIPNTNPVEIVTLLAGPARFGPELQNFNKVIGKLVFTYPAVACTDLVNEENLKGKIAIMERGNCMFIEKARRIQKAGAIAGIVLDNVLGSSAATSPMFAMSGDGKEVDDVKIPVVFLFNKEAEKLMKALIAAHGELSVTIGEFSSEDELQLKAPTDLSMFERIRGSIKSFISQQAAPQNPESSGPNKGVVDLETSGTKDMEKETKNKPSRIYYRHLHAEIIDDSLGGEVRVTLLHWADHIPEISEDLTTIEMQWKQLKEAFVTFLFSGQFAIRSDGKGLKLRSSILLNYYNWVMKGRSADNFNFADKTDLKRVTMWFLKELCKVKVNHWISFDHTKIMNSSRQKLLRQHLFTKLDITVLSLRAIVNKIKDVKAMKPEMSHLLELTESRIERLEKNTLRLLRDMKELYDFIDEEDESINQHIALVDSFYTFVRALYQNTLFDGMQKNLRELEDDEIVYDQTMDWFINSLQGGSKKYIKKNITEKLDIYKFHEVEYYLLKEMQTAVNNSVLKALQKARETTKGTEPTHSEATDNKDEAEQRDKILHSLANYQPEDDENAELQNFLESKFTSKKDINNNESVIKSQNKININIVHGSINEEQISTENQEDSQKLQNRLKDESDIDECMEENSHDKKLVSTDVVNHMDHSQEESQIKNVAHDTIQQSKVDSQERHDELTKNEDTNEHTTKLIKNEL